MFLGYTNAEVMILENNLKNESSPYLLQHKENPVHWFPWCEEAFAKAKSEDKPIFLSIGYSTCHWCHVMAHECFEDQQVAEVLNNNFISIKVDKEERPDIDSVYMSVCLAFTGSGGWPMSTFMTPQQQPFYAGTYYPKDMFIELLTQIYTIWKTDRNKLIDTGKKAVKQLNHTLKTEPCIMEDLINRAAKQLKQSFDRVHGGFGAAPKFPAPHNLLFLMEYYVQTREEEPLTMTEKTLQQMYKGGIFDHIGFGFSRYATDVNFLVPHFEKMLYDNALLILSYCRAYEITKSGLYKEIAQKTAEYILREMTSHEGGFYSAQDADSDGVEGKYYVFDYDEIIELLGKEMGIAFNKYYGITKKGNFEGKNILNLLDQKEYQNTFETYFDLIYKYRKARTSLHLDNKILTSWSSLMIAAFARMYQVIGDKKYLSAAKKACDFIDCSLFDGKQLYVSCRDGKCAEKGFIDDYAFYIYARITMYQVTLEEQYLNQAVSLLKNAVEYFYDNENSGFFFSGKYNETLILNPKETYDGAMPSGNSVMAYNLVMLSQITEDKKLEELCKSQMQFMASSARDYPMGYSFYMLALTLYVNPPMHIVCTMMGEHQQFPPNAIVRIIHGDNKEYPCINGKTTYYVCKDRKCLPPVNSF